MEGLGEVYYNLGMDSFEEHEYETAVRYMIKAYELEYQKEQILNFLYSCFISPNEGEFQAHYKKNCVEIAQYPYEDLMLDFIPVSEEKYFIFNKKSQKFLGVFELEKRSVRSRRETIHSLLCTGIWDVREMIPKQEEKNWAAVYILLEGIEAEFFSFLKLPKFKELYLEHVVLLQSEKFMCTFFEQYEEFYLPKELLSTEPKRYLELLSGLHNKRIHRIKEERENVFLSICIPSYNRGKLALENVLHLLQCPYDAEIEIIVSNNGSKKETEGYEEIRNLNDCRIRYHAFEQNQGYAANVMKTLELAQGRYAVLTSDEDFMLLENMERYLSYLKANTSGGVFVENIDGFPKAKNEIICAGLDAVKTAMYLNYMTGITYSMEALKRMQIFQTVRQMKDNQFLETYIQMVLAVFVVKHMDIHKIDLFLWKGREQERQIKFGKYGDVLSYMLPQNRVKQFYGIMDVFEQLQCEKMGFLELFLLQCKNMYDLLLGGYQAVKGYKEIYSWEDTGMYIYREERKYLENFPVPLQEHEKKQVEELLKKIFLSSLDIESSFDGYTQEEVLKKKLLHQLLQMELEGVGIGKIELDTGKGLYASINMIISGEGMEDMIVKERPLECIYAKHWEQMEKENGEITPWDA